MVQREDKACYAERHHRPLVAAPEAPVRVWAQPVLHLDWQPQPSNPSESPEGNTA